MKRHRNISTNIGMGSLLVVLSIIACCLQIGNGLTCLHCDNIFQPRHCRTVSKCNDNEICGSELVSTNHGNLYKVGCFPKTTCQYNYSTQITCLQCCDSDLCNVNLCNQPDYPSPRGPVCFNCMTYDNNSMCHDIDFCARDEVCKVTGKLEFQDRIFSSSCVPARECKSGSPLGSIVVGKRSVHMDARTHEQGICDICCQSDVCNQDCDSAFMEKNSCQSNPCIHGTCKNSQGSYICDCYAGYAGGNCELDVDDCANNPCVGGTCIDLQGGFLCHCDVGYTGTLCQTNIDECMSNPCVNGTCVDLIGKYYCQCEQGYSGSRCEYDIDECDPDPCNNQTCSNGVNGYVCTCDQGYTGRNCETRTGPCSSNPCIHGTCMDTGNSFTCNCSAGYKGSMCDEFPRDCLELQTLGVNISGVYNITIQAISETIQVYCDMETDGGGWTVIQYRFNGSVDFYRNFSEYEYGFGDLDGEFWLGLRYIYYLSKSKTVLRIDLVSSTGNTGYEKFDNFYLSPGSSYTLHLSHGTGTAGDSSGMYYSVNQRFTTKDRDRDISGSRNCAEKDHGGWWYANCAHANLNGQYYTPGEDNGESGMIYRSFDSSRSLKSTKMMIRRK